MAKITDSTTLDGIWIGSKWNEQRAILSVPAGGAEEAGLLFLEAVDGSGTLQDGLYLWADSAGKLRYNSSRPTDEDADGAALDNTTIGGAATKALDNLASVAVNTTIVSDTNSTDDLGSTSAYWANTYTDALYVNDTAYLDGTHSAGQIAVQADLDIGASGTGKDVNFFGASTDLVWDASESTLEVKDNTTVAIGTGDDVTLKWDATDFHIDFASANSAVQFGAASPSDLVLHGSTADSDITWDASGDVLYAADDTHIGFGDGIDMYFNFDATDLELRQTVTGTGGLKIGVDDHGIDITIYGDTSGSNITWDASADTWTFLDSTKLAFGTADDITFSYDGTNDELDILGSGKTVLFGADDEGVDVKFFGESSGDYMLWDESADELVFGDGTSTFTFEAPASNAMTIEAGTANETINFGPGTNTDIVFHGGTAGADLTWDASADSLIAADGAILNLSAANTTAEDTGLILPTTAGAVSGGSPAAGQVAYDSTNENLYIYTGSAWKYVAVTT